MLCKGLCLVAGLAACCLNVEAIEKQAPGDATRGELLYAQCRACHSPGRNRTGPRHCGLLGRQVGTVKGFDYSNAMQQADFTWTIQTLDGFLSAPMDYMPGTRMAIAGIQFGQDRQDLIAYLAAMNRLAECQGEK